MLTRQGLPTLPGAPPVERGAYVLADGDDCILIGTGSEVQVALAARELLAADGISARVVSMPSFELFRAQEAAYRDEVLPPALRPAWPWRPRAPSGGTSGSGSTARWSAIDRFGVSAPGDEALEALGITAEAVAAAATAQVGAGSPST